MNGFDRFFGLFSPRSSRPLLRRPAFGGGESLERRSMLSASVDVGTGVLTIVGTEAADVISLKAVKQNGVVVAGSVKVRGVAGVPNNTVFTNVQSVQISALGGNDKVEIGGGIQAASGGLLAVTVDAGTGKDVVIGGDGDDTILGGDGKDNLRGGRGDDDIDGGAGDDNIGGDDGDDDLLGDAGRDVIRGGRGDDTMYGGIDDDKLFGDAGDDDLDGGRGDDDLVGGIGNDDDVDDDDDLGDRSGEDGDDNGNDDEDEVDGEDDDAPVGTPIEFIAGAATVTGTSANKEDKVFRSFTVGANSTLSVTMQNVANGRYPDLEIERQGSGAEFQVEMEPHDGGPTSAVFTGLTPGVYSLRLRSPDLLAVTYAIDLLLTPTV